MNTQILKQIAETIKRLDELNQFISANIELFTGWHFASRAEAGLVQLFPEDETPIPEKQKQAKAIAKAFGGEWRRESDGGWRNEGGSFTVFLHWVDCMRQSSSNPKIDLSDPEPAERDEPDYDAPRPLTALENYQQNDEHHVR